MAPGRKARSTHEELRVRGMVRMRPPLSRRGEWKGAEATRGVALKEPRPESHVAVTGGVR